MATPQIKSEFLVEINGNSRPEARESNYVPYQDLGNVPVHG